MYENRNEHNTGTKNIFKTDMLYSFQIFYDAAPDIFFRTFLKSINLHLAFRKVAHKELQKF